MSMLVSMTLVCVVISCMISVALIESPEILVPIDLNFFIYNRITVYNNPYTAKYYAQQNSKIANLK